MNQELSVNINIFDFKYKENISIGKSFKLRFSILENEIAEKKMIKGTQPIAGYKPKKPFITDSFQISDSAQFNQTCSFTLSRPLSLDNPRKSQPIDQTTLPVLVVELMVKDRTNDKYAKNFETDANGFSNIGHNMLKLKLMGQEVHQAVQVLFSDVLFCSVGMAFHIQTTKFEFVNKIKKSSKTR